MLWCTGFDICYGSDICKDTKWDDVQGAAMVSSIYGLLTDVLILLLMVGTVVLVGMKHAAISKMWKVLAVMPLLVFLGPILNVAVSAPAQLTRRTGAAVAAAPTPIFPPRVLLTPPFPLPRRPVLRNGRKRQGLQWRSGGA